MGNRSGVGHEAPAFSLSSYDGNRVALKDYRGDWFPVLVFFDAGDDRAARRLAVLSAAVQQFWGKRGQLVAISPATPSSLRELAARVDPLAFPLLADEDGAVSGMYGALDKRGAVAAWLACIVDRAGKIVWVTEGEEAFTPPRLLHALDDVVR